MYGGGFGGEYNQKITRVEMFNSHMFAMTTALDYSFSTVPYLKQEEKITDQSNFVNDLT